MASRTEREPIELPPVEPRKAISYIASLFGGSPDFTAHAELVADAVGDNPRTLKRFVDLLVYTPRVAEAMKDRILNDAEAKPENKAVMAEHFIIAGTRNPDPVQERAMPAIVAATGFPPRLKSIHRSPLDFSFTIRKNGIY